MRVVLSVLGHVSTYHIKAKVLHDLVLHTDGSVAIKRIRGPVDAHVLPSLPLVDAHGLEGVLEPGQVTQPVQVRRDRSTGKKFSLHG